MAGNIPTYESQATPTVGGERVNLTLPNDGGVAKALEQAGASADRAATGVAEDQRKAADKAEAEARAQAVAEQSAGLGNDYTDLLNGNPTPSAPGAAIAPGQEPSAQGTEGFTALKGKTAAEASPATLDRLAQLREQRANAIKDSDARRLFLMHSAGMLTEARMQVERHVGQQIEVAKEDTAAALDDEAVRASSVDPTNSALAAQRIAGYDAAVHEMGRGEAFEGKRSLDLQQKVATARVAALLDSGDWRSASGVLEENRYALGERAAPLEKAIRTASGVNEADDTVTGILKSARQPNGFIDQAKAISDFEALPGDKRTRDAEAAFTHRLELAQKQEVAMKSGQFDTALSAYLTNHNINDVPALTKSWLHDNDPKGWHALEQVVHNDNERKKGAGATDAQRRAFAAFDVDLHDNPDKYATMSVAEFNRSVWPNLASADREKAAALFAAAHGQAAKPGTLTKEESDMLLQAGRDQGLFGPKGKDVSTWNDEQAQLHYAASEALTKKATAYRKMNGKPPPFEVVKGWTDELMQQGKIPGSGYFGSNIGAGATRLEAIQKGKEGEFVPKWSDAEIAEQAKRLQRVGLPTTPENIDTALRRRHGLPSGPISAPTPGAPTPGAPPSDAKNSDDWGLDLSEPAPELGD